MAATQPILGFIGLGTMGEPMCRNLAKKSEQLVIGFDVRLEPINRLARQGVEAAASVAEVVARADIIFLSLPSGDELADVIVGEGGILEHGQRGQTVVDHTTAPVGLTRELAEKLEERSIEFLDAPVARTRKAAVNATLAVMVGGSEETFARVEPYLKWMGSHVTYCGPTGNGQTAKLINNMVLIETVAALADALAIGRRAGLDGELLFKVMSNGSADSFALRNHGMGSMVKGEYPEDMFSTLYALKDLGYALELARETRVEARLAKQVERLLRRTIDEGLADVYFPAIYEIIEDRGGLD
jgi:3-hydroxyisobutyrate dehydrogenase-like beta-hydroxyacid dehydrogenase